MGTIVVNTNMTLDGVVENPTGEDGPGGGWFNAKSAADQDAWAKFEFEEALDTDALLLGGRPMRGSPSAGTTARASGPTVSTGSPSTSCPPR